MSQTIHAPAKINLTLDVLSRRADGYHEIATIFLALTLSDTLTVERTPRGIEVTCDGFDVPQGAGNIVHRAADLGLKDFDLSGGCRIHIQKLIPPGGGLGGGSSDAAAAIRWLAQAAGASDPGRLRTLAAQLGSDVPFFLDGGCALARGRGEILSTLPCPPAIPIVIIHPGDPVHTRAAYARVTPSARPFEECVSAGVADLLRCGSGWRDIAPALANDFEAAILPLRHDIGEAKQFLIDRGALGALMAGSGATVFGIFEDAEEARAVADVARLNFGWAQVAETAKE